MKYVVRVERRRVGETRIEHDDEYIASLRWDPYCKGDDRAHYTTPNQSEAFKFRERAAAEMAAVYVGGRVVKLTPKVRA